MAEGGDFGADAGEAFVGGGRVAIEQQGVEAVGAEEGALAGDGDGGAAGFGDAVGVEEEQVGPFEGDGRLALGLVGRMPRGRLAFSFRGRISWVRWRTKRGGLWPAEA